MITGFHFNNANGDTWWEEKNWFKVYYWVFNDADAPNGIGVCLRLTYTPR